MIVRLTDFEFDKGVEGLCGFHEIPSSVIALGFTSTSVTVKCDGWQVSTTVSSTEDVRGGLASASFTFLFLRK